MNHNAQITLAARAVSQSRANHEMPQQQMRAFMDLQEVVGTRLVLPTVGPSTGSFGDFLRLKVRDRALSDRGGRLRLYPTLNIINVL